MQSMYAKKISNKNKFRLRRLHKVVMYEYVEGCKKDLYNISLDLMMYIESIVNSTFWTLLTCCVMFQWIYIPSLIQRTQIWSYFGSCTTCSTHPCCSYRLGRMFIDWMWYASVQYYKINFFHHSRDYCTRIHERLHIQALFEVSDAFGLCLKLHRTSGKVWVFYHYPDVDV